MSEAMRVHELGEPEAALRADEVTMAEPGPGQVHIDVRAIGCNFADILICQGKYQLKPQPPFSPGSEVAGVVRQVGSGVAHVSAGERVLAVLPYGGYASEVIAEATDVFAIPASMSFEHAAAFGVVYQTAYFGLVFRGRLQRGETVLIHAAAGGAGLAAVQIAKALGATVIGTAGSSQKLQLVQEHGADHTLSYREDAWPEKVRELTRGHGADVVYDPVGGDAFEGSTKCIAFDGRIVVVGFASGTIPSVRLNRVMLKNIAVVGLHWAAYKEHAPQKIADAMHALFELYEAGGVHPVIHGSWPLKQAAEALRELASRRTSGKVLLRP